MTCSLPDTFPHWIYDGSDIPDPKGFGERAVQFLHKLQHPKSKLPSHQFQLNPWFERVIRATYGPRKADGSRLVNTVVIVVPRGNWKTTYASSMALLHTIGPERVVGGEAVFAASDRNQAGIAFREAVGIVRMNQSATSKLKIYDAFNSAKKIVYPTDGTTLEVISSDGGAQHGRTPSFVLADELHIWPNRLLWEALTTGLDKTDDTLLVVATTAGRGQDNIAFEIVERARKVARGEIIDPTLLPVLFEAPADAAYDDEELWRRLNPNSPHGYPSIEGYRRHVARAKTSPGERDSLRQLKLNVWLNHSTSPFVDMATYDLGSAPVDYDTFAGQPCWIGVDMATTTDLCAVVACFRDGDTYTVLPHFFCPEADIRKRGDVDGVDYVRWAKESLITATPGNVIDNGAVANYIAGLCERFGVREIGFDPAYAQAVIALLSGEHGDKIVTIRQGWVTQSPALNTVERAIIGGNFRHGGNEPLRWCFSNIAIHTDSAGNRVMHKGKSTDRIDGAAATWMAVSRAAANENHRSVYEDDNFNVADWL